MQLGRIHHTARALICGLTTGGLGGVAHLLIGVPLLPSVLVPALAAGSLAVLLGERDAGSVRDSRLEFSRAISQAARLNLYPSGAGGGIAALANGADAAANLAAIGEPRFRAAWGEIADALRSADPRAAAEPLRLVDEALDADLLERLCDVERPRASLA